jgi:hypothetical protein
MRHNEVNDGIEVAAKHTTVYIEDSKALFKQNVGRGWWKSREIWVTHWRRWQWPSHRSSFKGFNESGRNEFKRFV